MMTREDKIALLKQVEKLKETMKKGRMPYEQLDEKWGGQLDSLGANVDTFSSIFDRSLSNFVLNVMIADGFINEEEAFLANHLFGQLLGNVPIQSGTVSPTFASQVQAFNNAVPSVFIVASMYDQLAGKTGIDNLKASLRYNTAQVFDFFGRLFINVDGMSFEEEKEALETSMKYINDFVASK